MIEKLGMYIPVFGSLELPPPPLPEAGPISLNVSSSSLKASNSSLAWKAGNTLFLTVYHAPSMSWWRVQQCHYFQETLNVQVSQKGTSFVASKIPLSIATWGLTVLLLLRLSFRNSSTCLVGPLSYPAQRTNGGRSTTWSKYTLLVDWQLEAKRVSRTLSK